MMKDTLRTIFKAQGILNEEAAAKLISELNELMEAMDKDPPTARALEILYPYYHHIDRIDVNHDFMPYMRQAVQMLGHIERDSAYWLNDAAGYDEPPPRIKWRLQHHFSQSIPSTHQLAADEGYIVVEFSAYQDNGVPPFTYFYRSHLVVLGPLKMPTHSKVAEVDVLASQSGERSQRRIMSGRD